MGGGQLVTGLRLGPLGLPWIWIAEIDWRAARLPSVSIFQAA
jgi:hypothetical protein